MLQLARRAKTGSPNPRESGSEIRRNLSAALDHSRLEKGLKILEPSFSDENGPDYIMEVVRLIRKELE